MVGEVQAQPSRQTALSSRETPEGWHGGQWSSGMFALEPRRRFAARWQKLTVPSSMSLRQEPKSARRMWPFTSSRMLSGLMSLKEDRKERQGICQPCFYILKKTGTKTGKREVICTCVVGVASRMYTCATQTHSKKRVRVLHRQLADGGHWQHF